jgi:hypothetical protein
MPTILLNDDGVVGPTQSGAPASVDKSELFKHLSDSLDADLFVYSGSIDRRLADIFLNEATLPTRRTNVALVLCTFGGDADAAYIIARFLKTAYKKFILYVFGYCKSAGTLIALGADEIVMSHRGELGPLDVQVLKSDELVFRSSGLDIASAIKSLNDQAFETFEKNFLQIIKRGGGAITTRTAAEIASSLAVGLISPITDQIDPLRVGEMERAISIAYEYGIRLNTNADRVNTLIKNYPTHSFVIDFNEAKGLFEDVRLPDDTEQLLECVLRSFEGETGELCISHPNNEGLIGYLKPKQEQADASQQSDNQGNAPRPQDGQPLGANGNNNQAGGEGITPRTGAQQVTQAAEASTDGRE